MAGIRLTGMASGLDTEKIIKDLMKVQREPVNRLERSKILTEWKRDAYREMNTLLADLQTTVNNIRYTASLNKKVASSENDVIVSAKVIGKPQSAAYAIEVKQLAKAEMPAAVALTVDGSITSSGQQIGSAFTFTVEGKSIEVDATDTIDSVIQKINQSGAGVVAKFVDKKIVIQSLSGNTLGGDDKFSVQVTTGDGSKLGMSPIAITSSTRVAGQSGKVVINGVEHTFASNTFQYDGMEFTFKQTNVGSTLLVSTKTDEDAVFNSIKSFVDKYNEVIAEINKKISEPKYKGYQPLLDDEKEALDDKTAEKMDNMAKSGILLRDPLLTNALYEMRRSISTIVTGAGVDAAFDTFQEIGIGGPPTGKYAYQENGKLYIDEEKLRNAIRENGEDVVKLFTNFSDSADPAIKYSESGIAERLYNNLNKAISEITKQAGSGTLQYDDSYLSKKILDINEDIDRWEDRLKMIEDRYWKQFTAMESAMSKAQSQGSWFAQMLGQ